jgi:acetolactate synthase-1/2/3 large subunit
MKVSDYIADFLVQQKVRDIFLISGGGMMHLLDSVGKNDNLNLICNLNEQASSICADSYAQITGNLGVCLVTTGPGGTNAVTGIAASYLDSNPVLCISGQCKTADAASLRGVRQFGAQEVDIVSMVAPITKYAVKIVDKETVRYHLEKAVYLARHERKGPVWVDIPLDIQAAQIEPASLKGFKPEVEGLLTKSVDCTFVARKLYQHMEVSKRPLILIGGGVVLSNAKKEILELVHKLQIPVLATWRAKDVFAEDDPLYFGAPGIPTTRYSNYILQNCDLLIILGTRLNPALTAYDERHFAFQARKIIVDIDQNEINKLNMDFESTLVADCGDFIKECLIQKPKTGIADYSQWLSFCKSLKERYPLENEIQPKNQEGLTDGYLLARAVSEYSTENDIWVGSSSGRTCGISHMAVKIKKGQRFISSMGLGSMGFTLPSAIACSLATSRRTIALEGDGSLQHNIQELQLISNYKLPIKLFILSNQGYASIYMMQKNNFDSKFAACHEDTNVAFPSLKDVANCYHLDYYRISCNEEINEVVSKIMSDDRPVLCEVFASIYFDEIPKSMTIAHPDGTFTSSKLENLYPFLTDDEVKMNMPTWD